MTRTLIFGLAISSIAFAQISIPTGEYDQGRTSANLNETTLTTANVNTDSFGLLFTLPVDDSLYAQPLYMQNITIGGTAHNVVYLATINNSVYAFDADTAGAALWQVSLGAAAPVSPPRNGIAHCGILSTPVLDPTTNTMYVVAMTGTKAEKVFKLHALDITSGAEKFSGPVTIKAEVKGTGGGSVSGRIAFKAAYQFQRPALLLQNGAVYMAFATQVKEGSLPYHGWILGYNASTLAETFAVNTTPNGSEGGIWMSSRGPAADATGFTVLTGNGDVGNGNVGESFARYGATPKLLGHFTAPNYADLNTNDFDLGAGGPMLIPGTSLLAGGGKTGTMYLIDITRAGSLTMKQSFAATPGCPTALDSICAQIHHLTYWNRTGATLPLLYLWGSNDVLKAFSFSGGLLSTSPVAQNTVVGSLPGGGALALSANGSTTGTGILWANGSTATASLGAVPGILHAYDASNVATELWNSTMNASDNFGNFAKFVVPVVANGKVYMATFSKQLAVYGLK